VTAPTGVDWDPEYVALARSDLLARLARAAYGEAYPLELRPYGATTWPLLQEIAGWLVPPGRAGGTLLDLGCGEGGPGLWLAGATGATLIGLDFSTEALRRARAIAASLPYAGRHYLINATFTATGLRTGGIDAAVSLDALTYCDEPAAAFAELGRVLRPGGRVAATVHEAADEGSVRDYRPVVERAGLALRHYAEVPGWREPTRRNYRLWLERADELRAELGAEVAAVLLEEAERMVDSLDGRRQMLLVAVRS
jgi:SAM-dependent methyltransferase